MSAEILKSIMLITAEYDLPIFTDERIRMWEQALSAFPAGSVSKSVTNHITTSSYKPQLADIVKGCEAQEDSNWLGAEEAWALAPKSESDSAMVTPEIAEALASISLMNDPISARMAFKETYLRLVAKAKIERRQPRYFASLGTEINGRVSMLAHAVKTNKIALDAATSLVPELSLDLVKMCGAKNHPLLAPPNKSGQDKVKTLLLQLKG